MDKIEIYEEYQDIHDFWDPKILGKVDDFEIKIVKIKGDFTWHKHKENDECFLVMEGEFRMDFRDRQITVGKGEIVIVPKNVEHKPFAEEECKILLFEKENMKKTGD